MASEAEVEAAALAICNSRRALGDAAPVSSLDELIEIARVEHRSAACSALEAAEKVRESERKAENSAL